MTQNERLDFLINHLISEDNRYSNIVIPKDSEEKFNFFRSLVNVREPKQISNEFIKLQDDYLQERLTEINIVAAIAIAITVEIKLPINPDGHTSIESL